MHAHEVKDIHLGVVRSTKMPMAVTLEVCMHGILQVMPGVKRMQQLIHNSLLFITTRDSNRY